MNQIGWIIGTSITTLIAVVGWIMYVIRDIKKTAIDLKECVAEHDIRIGIVENNFSHIQQHLEKIERLLQK